MGEEADIYKTHISVTTGATNYTILLCKMSSTTRLTVPPTILYNGYRDPAYLDNVVVEMAAQAIEERDNEGEESSGSDDDL